MKIDRANKRSIQESNDLPDVSSGVMMFFQTIKVDLIKKQQIDGYTDESNKKCVLTQGVRQPFTARQLVIKPEGERGWEWSKLYSLPNLCLNIDDIVKISGIQYRVMTSTNWSEYGYIEYDMVEDYKHER